MQRPSPTPTHPPPTPPPPTPSPLSKIRTTLQVVYTSCLCSVCNMYVSAAYPGQPPAYSQQNQGAYPPQPPGYVAEQQPYPAQPYQAQLQGYPQPAGYPATDFKQYPPDYNYPQPGVSQYPPTAQQQVCILASPSFPLKKESYQASRSVLVVHEQPTISTQAVSYGRTGDYFLTLSVIMTAVCCIFGGWWNLVLTIPAVVLAGSVRTTIQHACMFFA